MTLGIEVKVGELDDKTIKAAVDVFDVNSQTGGETLNRTIVVDQNETSEVFHIHDGMCLKVREITE